MLEDYCVIDLEMTGLNPKHHKILEVAAVRVRKKEIVSECSMLIRQHQLLEEKITELTGIDQEMLAGAKEEDEVLDHFFGFLGEDILVGQNVIFDYSFLKQAAGVGKKDVGCSLRILWNRDRTPSPCLRRCKSDLSAL